MHEIVLFISLSGLSILLPLTTYWVFIKDRKDEN